MCDRRAYKGECCHGIPLANICKDCLLAKFTCDKCGELNPELHFAFGFKVCVKCDPPKPPVLIRVRCTNSALSRKEKPMEMIDNQTRDKIVKFLSSLGSHDVYAYEPLVRRFKKETGLKAPWSYVTRKMLIREIKARSSGGTLRKSNVKKYCSAYVVADRCADEWGVPSNRTFFGVGTQFWDAIRRIQERNWEGKE